MPLSGPPRPHAGRDRGAAWRALVTHLPPVTQPRGIRSAPPGPSASCWETVRGALQNPKQYRRGPDAAASRKGRSCGDRAAPGSGGGAGPGIPPPSPAPSARVRLCAPPPSGHAPPLPPSHFTAPCPHAPRPRCRTAQAALSVTGRGPSVPRGTEPLIGGPCWWWRRARRRVPPRRASGSGVRALGLGVVASARPPAAEPTADEDAAPGTEVETRIFMG